MRVNKKLAKAMRGGLIGIEKENVRVDENGNLALTNHPEAFGIKDHHPYIQVDFSESQIEMITPPLPSIEDAYHFLENIHDIITVELTDEYLWPASTPPILPGDENVIPIAIFESEKPVKYRERLAKKYGRKRQLLSGVHANISFTDEFFMLLKDAKGNTASLQDFKNEIYLQMSRVFLKHLNLLVRLTGASPVIHGTYIEKCVKRGNEIAKDSYQVCGLPSIRNSECGYTNTESLPVSFETLSDYVGDLKKWINGGYIQNEKEFYCAVRLKSRGETLTALEKNGIDYLEIRLLDLNPFEKIGVSKHSLYLLRAILLQAAFTEDIYEDQLLNTLLSFVEEWKLGTKYEEAIKFYLTKEQTIAEDVVEAVQKQDFIQFHMEQVKQFKEISLEKQYLFSGSTDMELSTQIVLKDAIKKGISFQILDRNDNFIALSDGNKTEYVKQATKTSLDSYSTIMVMENKLVTKHVLHEHQIHVPEGIVCHSVSEVVESFDRFAGKPIVVKPNSTNFGLGITILSKEYNETDLKKAGEYAFSEDSTVLVEEFYAGEEYRFLVIADEVVGILHRVPANVTGDGIHSIRELVAAKNEDPLRGVGHKTPLEKIRLGEAEAYVLKAQGMTFDSIPGKDEVVFLRENSNISTGGDSIDYTERIHESYKEIAREAAQVVGAVFCGIDIIIEDIEKPATTNNYVVIELNFNPAIHIHCYPYEGKNRKIGEKILAALFPHLKE